MIANIESPLDLLSQAPKKPGRSKQAWPQPGHPHQQRAIAAPKPETCRSSPQGDIELMTEKENLGFKPAPRLEQIGDKRSKQAEERKHRMR